MIQTIIATITTIEFFGSYIACHLESGATIDLTNRRNRKITESAIPMICLEMIAQGHDPQECVPIVPKLMDGDGLMTVFDRDRKLEKWAAIDVSQNEGRGPHTIPYRPFPDALKRKDAHGDTMSGYTTQNTKRLLLVTPSTSGASA